MRRELLQAAIDYGRSFADAPRGSTGVVQDDELEGCENELVRCAAEYADSDHEASDAHEEREARLEAEGANTKAALRQARDLCAWAMRILEDRHDAGCPADPATAALDAAQADCELGACECVVAEFASAVLDLDIEPCARCDQREATEEVDGLPICAQCKQEVE